MKAMLICPAERPGLEALTEFMPLVLVPVQGKSLLELWLERLVMLGAREVKVLVVDRPEEVRAWAGDGARWGLGVEVRTEQQELTPSEARQKYRVCDCDNWLATPADVVVIDHLPGLPELPMGDDYAGWFTALQAWMLHTAPAGRIGSREIQPGVWAGLRSRISPCAKLYPPCWIGEGVYVGARAVIGPETVLEDRVFVESGAEISRSVVFPETYVGRHSEVRNSLAWSEVLINWCDSSSVMVPDGFLLAGINGRKTVSMKPRWLARCTAFVLMMLTSPVALLAGLRSAWDKTPVLKRLEAIRAGTSERPFFHDQTLVYAEFGALSGRFRRWPQLWNVVRGDFTMVGNPPLTPAQAAELENDFERLWLAAPTGLISQADAAGCDEPFGDEARAHAAFYAANASWRLDVMIMIKFLLAGPAGASGAKLRLKPSRVFQDQMQATRAGMKINESRP